MFCSLGKKFLHLFHTDYAAGADRSDQVLEHHARATHDLVCDELKSRYSGSHTEALTSAAYCRVLSWPARQACLLRSPLFIDADNAITFTGDRQLRVASWSAKNDRAGVDRFLKP